ncbi:heterokaryon incompatibility [Colletotrichum camelliae]|nr:heterokaryon incompatibility [Colletotrichum camelliae]
MDGEDATSVRPGWKARPENRAQADAQLRKLLEPRERLKQRELLRQQIGADANNQSDDFEIDQLDGSLTVLSEQLYNKDTHFILELIQNADDNAYGASTNPSFGMRLDKNDSNCTFQTGCNELGFTIEQVDALCRIASSTKKNKKDVRTGYIGEKGIGFKAVFKVADVVYIKSGFYSFKLDKRNGMVGTLLPFPADFPASKYHEHDRSATRMTLLLKGTEQYDKISKELAKIKPEILLFLRRLRSISIYKGQEATVYLAMHNEHEEKLQGETKTIDCQRHGESFRNKKFLITRRMLNDMPNEEKRTGISASEITLAFPLNKYGQPEFDPQHVFSFLAIACYGFPFLIQGDFILLASREGLSAGNAWNNKLRDAIPEAFLQAVDRFNKIEGRLRYSWLRYLEYNVSYDPFWKRLDEKLMHHLRAHPILRNRLGNTLKPADLIFIPKEYRLEGEPLLDFSSERHLAFEYLPHDATCLTDSLRRLGVSTMNDDVFVKHFIQWITARQTSTSEMGEKSHEWHERTAQILVRVYSYRRKLRSLPIIPTLYGEFVPALSENLYSVSANDAWTAPSSLGLQFVDPMANENTHRARLFRALEIKSIDAADICYKILGLHREQKPREADATSLIEEAIYLFLHRKQISGSKSFGRIWLVTSREVARAQDTYLIGPDKSSQIIEQYQHIPEAGMKVIDPDYFDRFEQIQQNSGVKVAANATDPENGETKSSAETDPFHQWLTGKEFCQLATRPRLTFYHRDSNEDRLTREWKWLSTHAVMDLLLLMRDNWLHYDANRRTLIPAAKKLIVPCRDGKARELQESAIPSSSLLEACPHINFADIPEPKNEKWRFLSNFSVIVEAKDEARIRELEVLRRITAPKNTLEKVHPIYEYLAKNRSIMESFESRRLVFHPDQGWVAPKDCVWKSPAVLKRTRALCEVYPECDGLFQGRLGMKDAGMREEIQELETFTHSDQPEDTEALKSVILLLSEYLQQRKPADAENDAGLRERIKNLRIFPVISDTHSSDQPSVVKLRSLADDWYIADQSALRSAFLGRVELLDFDVLKEIDKLIPLIKWLDIDRLLLSIAVKESSRTIEPTVLKNDWSQSLHTRAKFASLLGNNTDSCTSENTPVYRLWQVSRIVVHRTVGQIHGLSEDGKIFIEQTDGFTDVYVLRDPFDNQDRRVSRELSKLFIDQYQITKPEHVTQLRDILGAKLSEMRDLLEEVGIRCPWSEETYEESSTESRTVNVPTISPATSTTAKKVLQSVNVIGQTTPACLSRPNGHTTVDRDRFKEVGVLGEAWMNDYFKTRIRNWDATRHWTSRLRVAKGYPDFLGDESKTADFTYKDEGGRMLSVIGLSSFAKDWRDKHITYHIEVKGTVLEVSEPFHMSQHQMDMALKHSRRELIPTDIYVIARVYGLGHRHADTRVRFYIDPWRYISAGRLNLKSEGYEVTPAEK